MSVLALIDGADLPDHVRTDAINVYRRLAEVEGAIHGTDPDAVELHEVGALDSILDVVGVCAALHDLGVDRVTGHGADRRSQLLDRRHLGGIGARGHEDFDRGAEPGTRPGDGGAAHTGRAQPTQTQALAQFELTPQRPTLLVTGGSRGIGLATAEVLVRERAKVVIAARRQELDPDGRLLDQHFRELLS